MEHFANSRFWRAAFLALVGAVAWLAVSLSGSRSIMPAAQAGGVYSMGGVVYTTSEAGDVLYVWPTSGPGGASQSWMEQWSWSSGTVTRKPIMIVAPELTPGAYPPGAYPPGPIPPNPAGTPQGRYGGH